MPRGGFGSEALLITAVARRKPPAGWVPFGSRGDFDPSKHPRDPKGTPTGGRFTSGDGGDEGASEPKPPGGDGILRLVGSNPNSKDERFDRWKKEIDAQIERLEKEGKIGNREYINYSNMAAALSFYESTSQKERDSGAVLLMHVHGGTHNSDEPSKLLAAVASKFDANTKVGEIIFNGHTDRAALVKALSFTIAHHEDHGATRIEAASDPEDTERISAMEEAGFRKVGEGKWAQPMVWGTEQPTAEDRARLAAELEHLPVPVQVSEGTGTDFKADVAGAIKSIPVRTLKRMAEAGIKIRAGTKLTELNPDLKGVHPRGWPAGTTWDSADGMFNRGQKAVNVTEFYRPIGKREFVRGSRIRGVLLHESGHGFDLALDYPSTNSRAFAEAYESDVKAIPKSAKNRLGYYLQKKRNAGRTETFAETFAWNAGTGSANNDIRPHFPRVTALVKTAMDRGLWLEPIA